MDGNDDMLWREGVDNDVWGRMMEMGVNIERQPDDGHRKSNKNLTNPMQLTRRINQNVTAVQTTR
jgi:hypothetical protein